MISKQNAKQTDSTVNLGNIKKNKMENQAKIEKWNNLPAQHKADFGNKWITHDTNLRAWCKPFEELSKLKQDSVLQSIDNFVYSGLIGYGIE